jgi:carbamoyltransferase
VGLRLERSLRAIGRSMPTLTYAEHHAAHAASAFYPSPFEHAAVLTFDGVGEWATTTIGRGGPGGLELLAEIRYPDSLGLLYSAVTAHCGFEVNDGEAKLMGLAPYGRPRYERVLRERVIELRPDGSFRLDRRLFDFDATDRMFRPSVAELFDGPPRSPDAPLGEREADLACSIQRVLDDAVLGVAASAAERTGETRACLAGGVALNCVTNARLLERGPFTEVWIQPAAGDAGGALGAALWHHHDVASGGRAAPGAGGDRMAGAALGPSFDDEEVRGWLARIGVDAHDGEPADLDDAVVTALLDGAIVGWFQGPMEFGPRALGNRSILADPRRRDAVTRINAAVKRREGFRPLAPAVLAERADELFELAGPSPYMLLTAPVRGARPGALDPWDPDLGAVLAAVDSPLPACTHVDGSARVQTVDAERFGRFHALLSRFAARSGCPALVNTSFNRAGEPVVATPADALRCAVDSGLDALVIGGLWIDGAALERLRARRGARGDW